MKWVSETAGAARSGSAHSQDAWRPLPLTPSFHDGVGYILPVEASMRAPSLIVAELGQVDNAERLGRLLDCLVHDLGETPVRGIGEGASRSAETRGVRYGTERSGAAGCDEKRAAQDEGNARAEPE